jgi:hypothetical protein
MSLATSSSGRWSLRSPAEEKGWSSSHIPRPRHIPATVVEGDCSRWRIDGGRGEAAVAEMHCGGIWRFDGEICLDRVARRDAVGEIAIGGVRRGRR